MSVLRLKAADDAALRAQARAAYPLECCGLLVGRHDGGDFVVTRVIPAANMHPEPHHHFELDPATHFAVLRQLRADASDEDILGHYHSHPDGKAVPSARDLGQAYDPDLLWLVMAVTQDAVAPPTAWMPRVEAGCVCGFDPVPVVGENP